MIGKEILRRVVRDLEKRNGTTSCRGELILEIQRELFGSVRIGLKPRELAEVFALIDDRSTHDTGPSPTCHPRRTRTLHSARPSETHTPAAVS